MLVLLALWPIASAVMAARWLGRDRRGAWGDGWLMSLVDEAENDRSVGIDQTWILESSEPERKKFDEESAARQVIVCRWDWGVEIERPVHSYLAFSASNSFHRSEGMQYLP